MISVVEIKTLQDANQLLLDRQYDSRIGRLRSDYLYRGVPSSLYEMKTSLFRNCKDLQESLEQSVLKSFRKYAVAEDPSMASSVWRQMVLGQHYGLPTRLLDWSHSALVAMHFATSESHLDDISKRDGVVWRIDARELSELLPENYKMVLRQNMTKFFSVDMLSSVAQTTRDYDLAMGDSSMVIVEPSSIDQRIINQYAYFSVVPMGIENIEQFLDENTEHTVKYIIDKNVRWGVRDTLDQLNISERILFPGLDGLSKWIARHYYVKGVNTEECFLKMD